MKTPDTKHPSTTQRLERLRAELRQVDDQLMAAVKRRMQLAKAIGDEKATQGLDILDSKREAFNREQNRTFADYTLPIAMVDALTEFLAHWSRTVQKKD
jgi:chorismate mutase